MQRIVVVQFAILLGSCIPIENGIEDAGTDAVTDAVAADNIATNPDAFMGDNSRVDDVNTNSPDTAVADVHFEEVDANQRDSSTPIDGSQGDAPVACFSLSTSEATTLDTVTFDASCSVGEDLQYRWDRTSSNYQVTSWSSEPTLSHRYRATAHYTITLEVRDQSGRLSTAQQSLVVHRAGSPSWLLIADSFPDYSAAGYYWPVRALAISFEGAELESNFIEPAGNRFSLGLAQLAQDSDLRCQVFAHVTDSYYMREHNISAFSFGVTLQGGEWLTSEEGRPWGAVQNPFGDWLVSTTAGVLLFDDTGEALYTQGGSRRGYNFDAATKMVVAPDGTGVLVIENHQTIQKYKYDASNLGRFDPPGALSSPAYMTVRDDGHVLVSDASGKIVELSETGSFVATLGSYAQLGGTPGGIDVASDGTLYAVVDQNGDDEGYVVFKRDSIDGEWSQFVDVATGYDAELVVVHEL